MKIQLVPHAGQPSDFLHLPWDVPLEDWPEHRLVQLPRGISRHVVRFVVVDSVYYALKELPSRLAQREYRLLHALAQRSVPAVIPAGLVTRRGDDLDAMLITRHLEFSRPYRLVLAQRPSQERWDALLDALAQLLVRLHLAGFFWGDCSLSNVLFRRDAGALCAYLVDAETGAQHDVLSDGQRRHDLEIAEEHLLGEICDLAAQADEEPGERELSIGRDVATRYDALWQELTGDEEIDPTDARRVDARIRRLNELGFDVGEIELVRTGSDGYRLHLDPRVVEPGHHRRRLQRLTGLDAQENQARRLLEDIADYRSTLEQRGEPPVSELAAAARWLSDAFEPALAAIPPELRGKRAPAELYHELLVHRWLLSERAGRDVGLQTTVMSYVGGVLQRLPDEQSASVTVP